MNPAYEKIARRVNKDFGLPKADNAVTAQQVQAVAKLKAPSSHPVEGRIQFYLRRAKRKS